MNNILIIGAIDRFNYGDLLFPHIIEKEIKKYIKNEVKFDYYGLIESNLENSGGKSTKSLKQFYHDLNNKQNVTVIVAGGEVLTPDWAVLNAYLNKKYKLIYDIIIKLKSFIPYSRRLINSLAMKQLGGKTKFPFIIEPENFNPGIKIIYNAVGGYNISRLARKELLNSLPKYTYFSVRDGKAYAYFLEKNLNNVELKPDSAILLSDHYPVQELKELASREVQELINSYSNGYLVFQVAYYKFLQNKADIINLLDNIYKKYHLPIVLCPIGTAIGHEDNRAANQIGELIKAEHYISRFENIWDIMLLIASSKFFIGTSLHGAITAMTYNVPYICVDKKQLKLHGYLETWAPEILNKTRDFSEVLDSMDKVFSIPKEILNENKNYQIKLAKESFQKIISKI